MRYGFGHANHAPPKGPSKGLGSEEGPRSRVDILTTDTPPVFTDLHLPSFPINRHRDFTSTVKTPTRISKMTTAFPPGGTYFDGRKSFADVNYDASKDNAINTTQFLEAAESLTTLFDVLGSAAFKPVKSDMQGNIKVSSQAV